MRPHARNVIPVCNQYTNDGGFIVSKSWRILMQTWFTFDPKIAERFQDMFVAMAGLGGHFWTEHLSGASAPTRPRRAAA